MNLIKYLTVVIAVIAVIFVGCDPDQQQNNGASQDSPDTALDIGTYSYELVSFSGGSFPYGENDDEFPSVEGFEIGATEVPYGLWREVYEWATSPAQEGLGYNFKNAGRGGSIALGDTEYSFNEDDPVDHPVVNQTVHDLIVWCNALSEMQGLTPVYWYDDPQDDEGAFIVRDAEAADNYTQTNWENDHWEYYYIFHKTGADGYRLPMDREWACAGRHLGRNADNINGAIEYPADSGFFWLPGSLPSGGGSINDSAYYSGNSNGTTKPVGGLPSGGTGTGMFDMSGNVSEWVEYEDDTGFRSRFRNTHYNGLPCNVRISRDFITFGEENDPYVVGFRIARSSE